MFIFAESLKNNMKEISITIIAIIITIIYYCYYFH